MLQIKSFSDERLNDICIYCGQASASQDHVPSKILLEEPFPKNLPVVPCCIKCNQLFSLDEEYLACAIECLIHGSTEIKSLKRDKIKRILSKKPSLQERIERSFILKNENTYFNIELQRFENIFIKLAKGHLKYENSIQNLNKPSSIWIKTLLEMNEVEANIFFSNVKLNIAPEVGSRSLQEIMTNKHGEIYAVWKVVQENIYCYITSDGSSNRFARILLWNYFAVEVSWDNE